MITRDRLKELLRYDQNTGIFTWLISPARTVKVGDVAGSIHEKGYRIISVDYKAYRAHRLAWLYIYGGFPKDIDHINGVRDDNRLINLRECSNAENHQNRAPNKNSTSRYVGVCWYKPSNKWQAKIKINYKDKHLGYFVSEEEAFAAYSEAKKQIHTFNPLVRSE